MQYRNSIGQFAGSWFRSLSWQRKACLALMVMCAGIPLGGALYEKVASIVSAELTYIAAPRAEAEELVTEKTSRELRDEMMDKLHRGEGAGHAVKEGDIFLTFDPPASLREACARIGGVWKHECFSVGEYQMKVSFIQHYFPFLEDGGTISEVEAILLANDPARARAFAERCIVEVEGCIWQWSAAKAQESYFEVVVPIIRKLEQ